MPREAFTPMSDEQALDEKIFKEIEESLLRIGGTQGKILRSAKELRKLGAPSHLIAAFEEADRELNRVHTLLMQKTYWAVPPSEAKSALF